jgi:tetratricopeptide (TPR) repeat protein
VYEDNSKNYKQLKEDIPSPGPGKAQGPVKLPAWKTVVFSVLPTVLLFILLETILMLVGVQPRLLEEDPFVGFVSSVPLFVEKTDAAGRAVMVTGPNKRVFFNVQQFPLQKQPGTYRIFCLGGSTTYGRPYSDTTSFCGWLRELLPLADPSRRWEVINAGGISYASYRVARLMEDLINYEPDLFIVYSGHNEFLEERTYGGLRDLPGVVKNVAELLARTRTWTALSSLMDRFRSSPEKDSNNHDLLPREVQAKLDYSSGLELYKRDDALQEKILSHYRFSLRHMVELARSVGTHILFFKPASNLKDFSPFKSQYTDGLDQGKRDSSEKLLATAREQMQRSSWNEALVALDKALAIDPRFAETHYLRGKALLALGRYDVAKVALRRARDEDVCPLRALSSIQEVIAEVTREADTPLVDFVNLLEQWSRSEGGHGIAGEEYFFDHVHPSIEVHHRLAVALIERMIEQGDLQPSAGWGESAIAEVSTRVNNSLGPEIHTRALANLSVVLMWAGRKDESRRLAFQALELGVEEPTMLLMVGRHLEKEGKSDEAVGYFRRAIRATPNSPVIHSQFGLLLARRRELEEAAAHLLLASLLSENNAQNHRLFGYIMAGRGRPKAALPSLLEARRLNPGHPQIDASIAEARSRIGGSVSDIAQPRTYFTRYKSGYPRKIVQTRPDASGRHVPDGILTEWYDRGQIKLFVDYVGGVSHGISVNWDESGRPLARTVYRHGTPMSNTKRQ